MERSKTLNFFRVLAFTTLLPYFSTLKFLPQTIGGFNFTGFAWLIMLFYGLTVIINERPAKMPFVFWIPWICYILIYNIFSPSFDGLQLSLQYICFIITGLAASSLTYSVHLLKLLFTWIKFLTAFVIIWVYVTTLIIGRGTPFSGQIVMTATFLAALYLSIFFITKDKKTLLLYGLLLIVPVINITRAPTAVMLATAVFHFANTKIHTKILFSLLIVFIGLSIFLLPSFQEKMFFSGKGTISELSWENTNMNTSGRNTLNSLLAKGVKENPVWGNGPRSDVSAFFKELKSIEAAHNDYLSVTHNYGYVGLFLLVFGFLLQFLKLYRLKLKYETGIVPKILLTTSLTCFIPWLILMYTDNILMYSVFFGNLHFALIGMLYSLKYRTNEYQRSNTFI